MSTSVATFKSAVAKSLDILRHPDFSITGEKTMNILAMYITSRFITTKTAKAFGIPNEYAWESMMKTMQTEKNGLQTAFDRFYHPEQDCLIRSLDREFKTECMSFGIKSVMCHKQLMETFDTIEIDTLDMQIDILGYVYELLLKESGSKSRHLGQYFTNRPMARFMVELCDPKLKSNGVPESVCDPAMGAAGFLVTVLKYFKQKGHTIDWSVQQKEIHGCETDPEVACIARMNFFMETRGASGRETLTTRNTLAEDVDCTGYDIILANFPFGVKKLVYSECCERIRNLKIAPGTNGEALFLAITMASLNIGGRAAVVVTDTFLEGNSKQIKETRKYLLDHFELRKVIHTKNKPTRLFMNTTICPTILFFENTGFPTSQVEFSELGVTVDGKVETTVLQTIPVHQLRTLKLSRYSNTHNGTHPSYPSMKLKDICDSKKGEVLKKENKTEGIYHVMGGGRNYMGSHSNYNRDGDMVTISSSGTAGYVKWHSGKFWAGDCFTLESKDETKVSNRFLYYSLATNPKLTTQHQIGGVVPHCYWKDVQDVEIAIPPIEVQHQIVNSLNKIFSTISLEELLVLGSDDKHPNPIMYHMLSHPDGSVFQTIVNAKKEMDRQKEIMLEQARSLFKKKSA